VEKAEATMEHDRIAILQVVEKQSGFASLHYCVNKFLHQMVGDAIDKAVKVRAMKSRFPKRDLLHAQSLNMVGGLLL
jgi:hypothetical protein